MACCIGIWIGSSILSSMLLKSDAFEIYKGGEIVWSSLEAKRLPNMIDLVEGFARVGVEVIPPTAGIK